MPRFFNPEDTSDPDNYLSQNESEELKKLELIELGIKATSDWGIYVEFANKSGFNPMDYLNDIEIEGMCKPEKDGTIPTIKKGENPCD